MFLFVLKKGPYILIWAYNELNPIHWAQTPNRDIAARRKAFRVSVHAIHSPMLCKVVSTVMVLYCDWSSGVTAGKSMGFFERQNRCRCVHLSLLQAFLSMHLNLSFMSKSVLRMLKQVSPCLSCHSPPPPHTDVHATQVLYQDTRHLNRDTANCKTAATKLQPSERSFVDPAFGLHHLCLCCIIIFNSAFTGANCFWKTVEPD